MGRWKIRKRRNRRKKRMLLVTVDKNDFVVSAMREIERSEHMPEQMVSCVSSYHSPKNREVPISQARQSARTHRWWCNDCTSKRMQYEENRRLKNTKLTPTPIPVAIPEHVAPLNGGIQHKWEVTIIKATMVTVYAKDYLDAGVEAGDGEVINVRRVD